MKKQNNTGYIYTITNIKNNKRYVGSTVNFTRRRNEHLNKLRKNKHPNQKLQNAFNKYGEESFYIEVIKHVEKTELLNIENEYLVNLKPAYNISKDASAPMTGRKHSKETLELFKTRRTGKGIKKSRWSEEARKNHLNARIGKKRSLEFKERRKQEAIADNRARFFDREKAKKPVKDSLGNQFPSMVECAKFHEMSVQSVCDILKGRTKKTKKGVTFIYA